MIIIDMTRREETHNHNPTWKTHNHGPTLERITVYISSSKYLRRKVKVAVTLATSSSPGKTSSNKL